MNARWSYCWFLVALLAGCSTELVVELRTESPRQLTDVRVTFSADDVAPTDYLYESLETPFSLLVIPAATADRSAERTVFATGEDSEGRQYEGTTTAAFADGNRVCVEVLLAPVVPMCASDDDCPPTFRCVMGACESPCNEDERVEDRACVPCAPGLSNEAGDQESGEDTSCDPILCEENEHVVDNMCIPCGAGSTNVAGDDASGDDTSCDPVPCEENEHVVDNMCIPCPAGSTNVAGDDASGEDTMCDGDRCPSNTKVEANMCVDCPGGTTNDAGDDASGPDTMCDVILCGANERVLDNMCVDCPAGSTNEAGDDASGPDTMCDDSCSSVLGVLCDVFNEAYIKASNTGAADNFGQSVALSSDGQTLAVGAHLEDGGASASGAVYVFRRTGETWMQEAYLKASNADANDWFGRSIALSADGRTLAVGAQQEDGNATGVGGDQTSNAASNSGAVYVFTRTGATWAQEAYIKASNTDIGDVFSFSVALSSDGNTLAASAYTEDGNGRDPLNDPATDGSGAVYVFTRTGGEWMQQAYLKASNPGLDDRFGHSVALSPDGGTLVVGAIDEDSAATGVGGDEASDAAPNSGAVYVFTRTGDVWTQQAYLKASNTSSADVFGWAVALSSDGNTLAVGARAEDGIDDGVSRSGAVYMLRRTGATWEQEAYIKASTIGARDLFGVSVALSADGDRLVVGARAEDSDATGVGGDEASDAVADSGALYLFARTAATWEQEAYIKASNTEAGDRFGESVALSADGRRVAVGAFFEDSAATGVNGDETDNTATDSGAVYVRRIAR